MSPSVSVVIPTKNRPDGLSRAVASVLSALPEDGEVIVVDDGSDQPATCTLREFSDSRMSVYVNPGPHGPSAARNFGVRRTRAPLLMFLDDDDSLVKDYCGRVIKRINTLPDDCAFGFSSAYHLEPNGSWTEVPSISPEGVLGEETLLKYRQAGLGMGFWITRAAFDAVGGLDESMDVNEDTEFSVRLAALGHRCYCDQTPGVVLTHDGVRSAIDQPSITKGAGARARFHGFEYILVKHRKFLKGHPAFRRKMFSRAIKYRVREGCAAGWFGFCAQHRPLRDVVLYIVPGALWLGLSKLVRSML